MSDKDAVKKLIGLLSSYKKKIIMILFCVILSTGMNLLMPLLSRSIMDDGFIGRNWNLLITLVVASAVVYIANALLGIVIERIRIKIANHLEFSLSEKAFIHLLRIRSDYFTEKNYAEIHHVIQADVGSMVSIANRGMFFVVSQVFSIAGGVVGLLLIDIKMTILVLLYIPVKGILMRYFAKKNKNIMDELISDAEQYARWFGDTVGGIKEVRLFGIEQTKKQEFYQKEKQVLRQKQRMNMNGEWNQGVDTIFIQILIMTLYILGASMVFSDDMTIGSIFAFVTYSSYVTAPISAILNIGFMFSGIIPSTKRFYAFMQLEEEAELPDAEAVPETGDIEVRDLSFSYEKGQPILEEICITFPQGSKTALIGKNGSGKSTLIGLLTRMYLPEQGDILLNGKDIGLFSLNEYRNMIAVVSQQVYLFNDTIRNNICLYKEIGDEELNKVIQECSLDELIQEVGLDHTVGRDGTMLSGGQKQKVALARALIHNKPVIIFDEATSNTDIYTETGIYELFETRLKDKTVIIVSHRREVLSHVDEIVFLENRKALQGDYDRLAQEDNFVHMMAHFKEIPL